MNKLELELKDDFDIVVDGHSYQIPVYKIESEVGLVEDHNHKIELCFVRGSKLENDKIVPQTGTVHEHLLAVMIHDLEFKNKLVESEDTTVAINHLKSAYNWLLRRQIERIKEGKLNTYKK